MKLLVAVLAWAARLLGLEIAVVHHVTKEPPRCSATTIGGVAGREYRRHCRVRPPHDGRRHRDGDHEWGDGVTGAAEPQLVDDDIGQGEGCEGGKCAIRRES